MTIKELKKELNERIKEDYSALDAFKADIKRSVELLDYEETEQLIKRIDLCKNRIDTLKEIQYMLGE